MRRLTYVVVGSACAFIVAPVCFYYFALEDVFGVEPSMWIVVVGFVPPLLLLVIGLLATFYGLTSSNIYNIKSGVVINRQFVPAHSTPSYFVPAVGKSPAVYILACNVPDTWKLQLRDESGRTGWISFDHDVLEQYPDGVYYP